LDSDNAAEDVDFVPENQDTEEESEAEDTQEDLDLEKRHTPLKDLRSRRISRGLVSGIFYFYFFTVDCDKWTSRQRDIVRDFAH
jgi:hypothetical protein